MKLLLSLNSWNPRPAILRRVLDHYATNYTDLDITVLLSTNYAFEYVGLPIISLPKQYEGQAYCWNNRAWILDHYQDYDYVIDSDDDVILPRQGFGYYRQNEGLPADTIAGFLTSETRGTRRALISLSPIIPNPYEVKDNWIIPRNVHSCLFLIDRARLTAIAPRLSRVPMRQGNRTIAEYARSEVYHVLKKVVSVDAIRNGSALVDHLENNTSEFPFPFPDAETFLVTLPTTPEPRPEPERKASRAPNTPANPAQSRYYSGKPTFAPCQGCKKK